MPRGLVGQISRTRELHFVAPKHHTQTNASLQRGLDVPWRCTGPLQVQPLADLLGSLSVILCQPSRIWLQTKTVWITPWEDALVYWISYNVGGGKTGIEKGTA